MKKRIKVGMPEKELNQLKNENASLKLALAELAESQEGERIASLLALAEIAESHELDKVATQLALAELAESIISGGAE